MFLQILAYRSHCSRRKRTQKTAAEIEAILLIQNWGGGSNDVILKYLLGFSVLKGDSYRKGHLALYEQF